jgi:hypothetical protein
MDPAFSMQRLAKHLTKFYDIAVMLCDTIEAAQQLCPDTLIDVTTIMSPFTIGLSLGLLKTIEDKITEYCRLFFL